MASNTLPFHTLNTPHAPPSAATTTFTLTPDTPTDIWRKPGPPQISTFNAPLIYKSIPLSNFQRARITVSAQWKTLYDQGGLVFILPQEKGDGESGKWIKTGIEFYQGEAYVSTVTKDRWADWSLVDTGIREVGAGEGGVREKEVTLEMERNVEEGTLWVYVIVGEGGKRVPVREVTWILSEGEEKEVWVGIYAAKPIKGEGGEELVVGFSGWELELK